MAQNYGSIDSFESKESFNNLVSRITNNLQNIRQITRDLSELCSIMGGPHDSPAKKTKVVQLQQKAKDLLTTTKYLFETISLCKLNDETNRLTITKVKEDYKNVTSKYNQVHQMVIDKLGKMVFEARNSMSNNLIDPEESSEHSGLRRQQSETDEEVRNEEILHNQIQQIEKDLALVQNLYTDINRIVVENQEQVHNIEINVITAEENVESANEKLEAATVYKKKALKKKICIIVTVIVILVIIALIIWLSVKK